MPIGYQHFTICIRLKSKAIALLTNNSSVFTVIFTYSKHSEQTQELRKYAMILDTALAFFWPKKITITDDAIILQLHQDKTRG